jgi:RimJ/RimL family protein N-acetyltransferase
VGIVLQTERLRVRRLTEADGANLFALDHDPDVLRYIPLKPHPTREEYVNDIVGRFLPYYDRHPHLGVWAVEEKAGSTFVGCFCLRRGIDESDAALLQYRPGDLELGYRLRRAAWGKGYATELAGATLQHAFTTLAAPCVVAAVSCGNTASLRVMEKVGLRRVGGLYHLPGSELPFVKFALTIAEFDTHNTAAD